MNIVAQSIAPTMAWTGSRYIDMLNPNPADIDLREIAVGLSREVRYGGAATTVPWSVAQHSLQALCYAREDGIRDRIILACILMHDAPEYMIRDVIAPLKRGLPEYRRLDALWWQAVAARFHLPEALPVEVKGYDRLTAASEKRRLISWHAGVWPGFPEPRSLSRKLLELDMGQVADLFLAEAAELGLS